MKKVKNIVCPEKDSFVVYPTMVESIKKLPDELRLEVYDALMEYGTTNKIPEGLSVYADAFIIGFSGGIIGAKKRRETSIKNGKKGGAYGHLGAEYGKLGGRPKKGKDIPPKTPLNVDVNENVNVNEYVDKKANRPTPRTPPTSFQKHNYKSEIFNSVLADLNKGIEFN